MTARTRARAGWWPMTRVRTRIPRPIWSRTTPGSTVARRQPRRRRCTWSTRTTTTSVPATEVMPWIELEGAANVRDLGGLPTEDDGETVGGRLLRGDNLQELSPPDAVAAVRHAHHPILPERGSATDVVADVLLARDRDEQDRSRYPADPLCGHYLGYLEDRPGQVVAALRSVAAADGAALVHCAAGKDRTGVVVALALTAVGVRPQDVVADYAATGERLVGLVERLRRSPIYAADINSRPTEQHRPRPQTMTAFLAQVRARYGGATRWLAGHGFGQHDLDRLHAKLRRT